MICGKCSKEQPFSNTKPCIGCGFEFKPKKSRFWEGGKGCRDPALMSRRDGHKFKDPERKQKQKHLKDKSKK